MSRDKTQNCSPERTGHFAAAEGAKRPSAGMMSTKSAEVQPRTAHDASTPVKGLQITLTKAPKASSPSVNKEGLGSDSSMHREPHLKARNSVNPTIVGLRERVPPPTQVTGRGVCSAPRVDGWNGANIRSLHPTPPVRTSPVHQRNHRPNTGPQYTQLPSLPTTKSEIPDRGLLFTPPQVPQPTGVYVDRLQRTHLVPVQVNIQRPLDIDRSAANASTTVSPPLVNANRFPPPDGICLPKNGTGFCWRFQRGFCPDGGKCRWIHKACEPHSPASGTSEKPSPPRATNESNLLNALSGLSLHSNSEEGRSAFLSRDSPTSVTHTTSLASTNLIGNAKIQGVIPTVGSRVVCFDYMRKKCLRGERCKYLHVDNQSQLLANPASLHGTPSHVLSAPQPTLCCPPPHHSSTTLQTECSPSACVQHKKPSISVGESVSGQSKGDLSAVLVSGGSSSSLRPSPTSISAPSGLETPSNSTAKAPPVYENCKELGAAVFNNTAVETAPASPNQPIKIPRTVCRDHINGTCTRYPFCLRAHPTPEEWFKDAPEVCRDHLKGQCERYPFCLDVHPPREDWFVYVERRKHPCFRFLHGNCNLGNRCCYAHTVPGNGSNQAPTTATPPPENAPSNQLVSSPAAPVESSSDVHNLATATKDAPPPSIVSLSKPPVATPVESNPRKESKNMSSKQDVQSRGSESSKENVVVVGKTKPCSANGKSDRKQQQAQGSKVTSADGKGSAHLKQNKEKQNKEDKSIIPTTSSSNGALLSKQPQIVATTSEKLASNIASSKKEECIVEKQPVLPNLDGKCQSKRRKKPQTSQKMGDPGLQSAVSEPSKGDKSQPKAETPPTTSPMMGANRSTTQTKPVSNMSDGSCETKGLTSIQPPSASKRSKKGDADGFSSDTGSFYSSKSTFSEHSSPRSSQSSLNTSLASSTSSTIDCPIPFIAICRQFRETGSCSQKCCWFLHPREYKTKLQKDTEDPPLDRLLQKLQASYTQSQNSLESVRLTHDKMPTRHSEQHAVPAVPPGLGLEGLIPATKTSNLHEKGTSETMSISVLDASKVCFGPGFEIIKFMTGFESREVIIHKVPAGTTSEAIRDILEPFGDVSGIVVPGAKRDGTVTVKATFVDHTNAAKAVAALDGARAFGSNITIRLNSLKKTSLGKGVVHDGDVTLEFPPPGKIGFVGYASQALAQQVVDRVNGIELRGSWVTAQLYEGIPRLGASTVRFCGLPSDAQVKDLEQLGDNEGVMLERANYLHLEYALEHLHDHLETFGELISLNVNPPPYVWGSVRAWAQFKSPAAAENACSQLKNRRQWFLGYEKLLASHIRSVNYTIPPEVFDALSFDIQQLRLSTCTSDSRCNITIFDRRKDMSGNPPVVVKLIAQKQRVLARLKASFETLLRGDRVVQDGEIVWDPFFVQAGGITFLQELQQTNPGVLINKDSRRRMLTIFGTPGKREGVKRTILAKVAQLRAQRTHRIPLDGRVIGLFMSADLIKLQEELGHENIILDPSRRSLTVRGNKDAYQVAHLAVLRARQRHAVERKRRSDACPVCFDEVSSPVTLNCGHTWCKSCLEGYMVASIENKVFPLTCLGDDARCSHPITLEIAREILSPKDFDSVARSSFYSYVHSRPSEFHYCPTPDCPQIYRSAPKGTLLQCPSCLVLICPNCHIEHHEGIPCRDFETEDKKLFDEWAGSHDVKNCPGCKVPIERSAGCNHMTCVQCKTHICWVCLVTFPTSNGVYDHMHDMHGGFGL